MSIIANSYMQSRKATLTDYHIVMPLMHGSGWLFMDVHNQTQIDMTDRVETL